MQTSASNIDIPAVYKLNYEKYNKLFSQLDCYTLSLYTFFLKVAKRTCLLLK